MFETSKQKSRIDFFDNSEVVINHDLMAISGGITQAQKTIVGGFTNNDETDQDSGN